MKNLIAAEDDNLTLIVRPGCDPVKVSLHIWRSWTGRRFLNGVEYTGPVYFLGSDEVSRTRSPAMA